MTGTRQRLTGRIQVSLPPDEAFRLFTPRGEQDWAAGWEPRFPAPAHDDAEPGTVFETNAHGQHTIWLVLDRQRGTRVSYARVTPGGLAGTVTVVVSAAGRHSEVDVTYDLTELTGAAGATGALRVEPARRSSHPRPAELVGGGQNRPAALAAAVRERYGVPDLVLCGDRSADRGTGSFPAFLAAALNAAQALGVVRLEPEGDGELRVHRRLDGGRREVLRVRRPAVVSVEAAGVRLRRAGLPETLASRRAVIPVIDAPAVAGHRVPVLGAQPYRPRPRELPVPSGTALHRTLQLTGALAEHTPPTVLGPLSPEQAADELLGYLRRRGYLAAGDPG